MEGVGESEAYTRTYTRGSKIQGADPPPPHLPALNASGGTLHFALYLYPIARKCKSKR